MSALPALTKTYATRANVPFPDVTTQANVRKSHIWLLKAFLMNLVATGTLAGTRHANSVWTCDYSCDSTTAGTAGDGVDRWTTFANVVGNTTGVAHSWIVLRNVNSGLYLLIDYNSTGDTLRVEVSKVAFTGGTTTTSPTSTAGWCFGSTTTGTGVSVTLIGDNAAGNLNYAHFTTTDDGRFFFHASRTGLTVFSAFLALLPSVNARGGDSYNWFAIGHASSGGRGAPAHANLIAAAGCSSRAPNGSAPVTVGGVQSVTFGSSAYAGSYGVDALSGDYLAYPMFVMSLSPQVAYRGQIPDVYVIGTATVGGSIPSAAAQQRVVAGDLVVPFTTTPPNI